MTEVSPKSSAELSASDTQLIENSLELMGFVSNDALTMARVPGLLAACASLVKACYEPGKVDLLLKRKMAYLVSRMNGCRYCEAHTAYGAGLDADDIAKLWSFDQDPDVSAAEKAALAMARDAGSDGALSRTTVKNLKKHYDDDAICELTAILSLFAFLNRWNTLLATELEDAPMSFAEKQLSDSGWQIGVHTADKN